MDIGRDGACNPERTIGKGAVGYDHISLAAFPKVDENALLACQLVLLIKQLGQIDGLFQPYAGWDFHLDSIVPDIIDGGAVPKVL